MTELDLRAKRNVLLLSVLGIFGLAVTEREGSYLLLAIGAAIVAWHLVEKRPRLRVPRLLINAGVLAALGYACVDIVMHRTPAVPALASCFVYCQIIKYFQAKTGREYGEMIVLSMMVMITAAALSADVLFAGVLLVYLYVGMHTLLLFGLKRGADGIVSRRASWVPASAGDELASGGQVVGGRLRLRWVTAGGGLFLLLAAAVVFATMPRLGPARGGGNWNPRAVIALTGFSDEISFGDIGKLLENHTPVMRVTFRRGGRTVQPAEPILLRGSTLLLYRQGTWRTHPRAIDDLLFVNLSGDRELLLLGTPGPADGGLEQEIWLEPISSNTLFAAYVPFAMRVEQPSRATFHADYDQSLKQRATGANTLHYFVRSASPDDAAIAPILMEIAWKSAPLLYEILPRSSHVPDRIAALAEEWTANLDPAVQPALAGARRIQERLMGGEYAYSLDVSDADPDADPVADFLLRRKTGYCVHFASAMALMCQSAGIPARLVNGFKQGHYNEAGAHYTFLQSDAHSWVEVLVPGRGWLPFDPTPPTSQADEPLTGILGQYADFLQHRWMTGVIHFGQADYHLMLARIETQWREAQLGGAAAGRLLLETITALWGRNAPTTHRQQLLIGGTFVFGSLLGVAACVLVVFSLLTRRRQRRAHRQRGHTAVLVEFYERIEKLLARRGFVRAQSQTHSEFAQSVLREAADTMPARLDDAAMCFYQVRFGRRPLSPDQQRIVADVVRQLQQTPTTRRSPMS